MVFYGTETSLEIDEDLDKDKPAPSPPDPEVIQDNAAVFDGNRRVVETGGDPWTGSQQVDLISHPEVQRPTTENQTSGACKSHDSRGCLGGCLILILVLLSLSRQIGSWTDFPSGRSPRKTVPSDIAVGELANKKLSTPPSDFRFEARDCRASLASSTLGRPRHLRCS